MFLITAGADIKEMKDKECMLFFLPWFIPLAQ
jgi:hypothetical protein